MSQRQFGPYTLTTAQLPSGKSVGLLFDPGDAGGGMACIDARESNGSLKATGCTGFDIVANQQTDAELYLQGLP
jgi:hypothetical protein